MGQQIVDWSLLENPDIARMLAREAAKVARQYEGVIEPDDLLQEGRIAVATQAHIVRNYLDKDDLGYLSRWIWQRITDVARRENGHHKRVLPIDDVVGVEDYH